MKQEKISVNAKHVYNIIQCWTSVLGRRCINVIAMFVFAGTLNIQSGKMMLPYEQQTQNICITFMQCWTSVEDVGPTLYKCYANVLCLLEHVGPDVDAFAVVVRIARTTIFIISLIPDYSLGYSQLCLS